jgi:hypothetical protein
VGAVWALGGKGEARNEGRLCWWAQLCVCRVICVWVSVSAMAEFVRVSVMSGSRDLGRIQSWICVGRWVIEPFQSGGLFERERQ